MDVGLSEARSLLLLRQTSGITDHVKIRNPDFLSVNGKFGGYLTQGQSLDDDWLKVVSLDEELRDDLVDDFVVVLVLGNLSQFCLLWFAVKEAHVLED